MYVQIYYGILKSDMRRVSRQVEDSINDFYKSMTWTLFYKTVYELLIKQTWHVSNSA